MFGKQDIPGEEMMKRAILAVFAAIFIAACSTGAGLGEGQIKNALEQYFQNGLQDRLASMVSLVGEKRAKEAIASAEGTADPAEVFIDPFQAEDIRELENGDFTAKVIYTLNMGDGYKSDLSERVTLTKLQDQWKVINRQPL